MIVKQLRLNRRQFILVRRDGISYRAENIQIYSNSNLQGMAVVISNKNNPSSVWRNKIRRYFYDTLKDVAKKKSFIIYFYTNINAKNYKDFCITASSLLSKIPVV